MEGRLHSGALESKVEAANTGKKRREPHL